MAVVKADDLRTLCSGIVIGPQQGGCVKHKTVCRLGCHILTDHDLPDALLPWRTDQHTAHFVLPVTPGMFAHLLKQQKGHP